METKSIVKPYGNNISVAFPLGMYILNVGKVSVALAYTNIGVLSLLHKTEQVCFNSPEIQSVTYKLHNETFLQKNICLASPGLCSIGQ